MKTAAPSRRSAALRFLSEFSILRLDWLYEKVVRKKRAAHTSDWGALFFYLSKIEYTVLYGCYAGTAEGDVSWFFG